MENSKTSCGGFALWERLNDETDEGFYYCSTCGRALDDHKA